MRVSINRGTPIAGWFIVEHPIKIGHLAVIWGYPHFRKPPFFSYSKLDLGGLGELALWAVWIPELANR